MTIPPSPTPPLASDSDIIRSIFELLPSEEPTACPRPPAQDAPTCTVPANTIPPFLYDLHFYTLTCIRSQLPHLWQQILQWLSRKTDPPTS